MAAKAGEAVAAMAETAAVTVAMATAAAMTMVAEMAVTAETAASSGVQAISEPRWLLWWQRRLWQQGDRSNGDMKQRQRCWQEMVAAMATAMAGSNGGSDGQRRRQ